MASRMVRSKPASRKSSISAALATGAVRSRGKVVEAPAKATVHTAKANDERRIEAAIVIQKDALKAAKEEAADTLTRLVLCGDLDPTEVKPSQADALSATALSGICRELVKQGNAAFKGYSGLNKAELVRFFTSGGVKPQAAKGSTRQLREVLSAGKKAGLVSGPISALKVADVKRLAAIVATGKSVMVTKSAPTPGTMDANKAKLRPASGKGFTPEATAKSKSLFGVSISALKAPQLAKLVAALNL